MWGGSENITRPLSVSVNAFYVQSWTFCLVIVSHQCNAWLRHNFVFCFWSCGSQVQITREKKRKEKETHWRRFLCLSLRQTISTYSEGSENRWIRYRLIITSHGSHESRGSACRSTWYVRSWPIQSEWEQRLSNRNSLSPIDIYALQSSEASIQLVHSTELHDWRFRTAET